MPPKASVTIRMKNGTTLSSEAAQGVQRLVAAAVPQLDANDVVIVDEEGRVISAVLPKETMDDGDAVPTRRARQAIELYYRARIEKSLEGLLPQGTVTIHVAVDPAASAQDSEILDWAPAARHFGLHATIISPAPLDPQTMTDARGLISNAIALDNMLGDDISFSRSDDGQAVAPSKRPAAPSPSRYSAAPAGPAGTALQYDWVSLTGIVLLLMLVAATSLLVASRRRGGRRLTAAERTAFAERLNAALSQGEADVAVR